MRLHALLSIFLLCPQTAGQRTYHSPHADPDQILQFQMVAVDLNATGSYSLLLEDLDNDGHQDLVLMAYSGVTADGLPGEVYWYQWRNLHHGLPEWKKRLVAKKPHVVHCGFMDVDEDGYMDIVFNAGFEVPPNDTLTQGTLWWAQNPGRPTDDADTPWDTFLIGRVVGNHRVAVGDFDNDGRREVVALPLFGVGPPPFYGPAAITLFETSGNFTDPWASTVLTSGVYIDVHDVRVAHYPGNGTISERDVLFFACHQGIMVMFITWKEKGGWSATMQVLHGPPMDSASDLVARDEGFRPTSSSCDPNPRDFQGVTALSKNLEAAFIPPRHGESPAFFAAIDYTNTTNLLEGQPWHGDTVAIYIAPPGGILGGGPMQRQVLERRFSGGHTAALVDLDQDDCTDVVAGFREYPTSLMLYRCVRVNGERTFRKQIISERGTNDIVVADFNNDGYLDLATCGFGGMDPGGGDPYVLIYLNRGNSSSNWGEVVPATPEQCTKEVIALGILCTVLMVSCFVPAVLLFKEKRKNRQLASELNHSLVAAPT